ncbi:MAG: DUF3303 domain-containing protein [Candidatus Acidiferrales bacterium]
MPGWGTLPSMLFMVIERFKLGVLGAIGERFRQQGRMLPEGVSYHGSWVDTVGSRCFQLMEATHLDSLKPWMRRWDDLMDFEIVPVMNSADFWAREQPQQR